MCTAHQPYRVLRRILSTSALVLLVAASVSAYTIVMRDGRRLEIPSRFVVTPSTLTYEVRPGIQITLQMATVDVSATERANNEPAGALLRRAYLQGLGTEPPKVHTSRATKTITNNDLKAAATRRIASELAYEKRARELGLPPLEESRRQAEAAAALAQSELRERLAAERDSEEYWRDRATALRTEMAALDGEIGYVRARLDEVLDPNSGGSLGTATSIVPFDSFGNGGWGLFGNGGRGSFGNFGRGGHYRGNRGHRASVYAAPRGIGPQVSGRGGIGSGATRGRVFIDPAGRGRFGRRSQVGGWGNVHQPWGLGVGIVPNASVFESSAAYDYSYERSELITRFNDLAAARAGLNARWRELEEEARRAGVPPGWLRR
jgi:hypothetical protein